MEGMRIAMQQGFDEAKEERKEIATDVSLLKDWKIEYDAEKKAHEEAEEKIESATTKSTKWRDGFIAILSIFITSLVAIAAIYLQK
jgi:vacuolar-type H+-ATPase subunit H